MLMPAVFSRRKWMQDQFLVMIASGFMVNDAIIEFWKSCNGKRKVTDLVQIFAQQTGLQRTQVEKEVIQLIKQLHEGGLLIIPNESNSPNVEFKKSN